MEILVAQKAHSKYAKIICDTIAQSAKKRGTGIAQRSLDYIISKMETGNAVIALHEEEFVGFSYIEVWGHEKFVANSGLIVHPYYRGMGFGKDIKQAVFNLSRKKFPEAKIFGITTGLAVMKMNYGLGYRPVTFSELTTEPEFWKGCKTCVNYDILRRNERKMCLCTGMLYDPAVGKKKKIKHPFNRKLLIRLNKIKQAILLKNKMGC